MSFSAGFSRGINAGSALVDMWNDSKEEKRQKEQADMYRGLSSDMSAYGYPEATKYKALASQAGAYGDLEQQQKFDGLSRQFEQEGIAETLKYLDAGQPDKALEFYNSTGGDRAKSLRYDRENDPDTIYFVDAEGNEGSVPRRALEAMTMSGVQALAAQNAAMAKKAERAHDINKIRVEGAEKRKTEKLKAQNGGGMDDASKVFLKNGKVVKESDLRGTFLSEYGRPDGMGNLILGQDAPSYTAWRNSVVRDDYVLPEGNALPTMSPEQIRQRAEQDVRKEMGLKDWIPFVEPSQDDIRRRAGEIRMERGQGRGLQPPNEPGASSQAPAELPPQAAQQLKEGVVTTFANGQRWTLRNGQAQRVE